VLCLDADERVTPQLRAEIEDQITRHGDQAVAFEIPRLTQFCGVWIRHCGWTPDFVLRLFRLGQARFSDDLVHESLSPCQQGVRIIRLRHPLLHYSAMPGGSAPQWGEQRCRGWLLLSEATFCAWVSSMAQWALQCVPCRPRLPSGSILNSTV
jgi:hypothetical protein